MLIPFNKAVNLGTETKYLKEVIDSQVLAGDGPFTKRVQKWFEKKLTRSKVLMTPSCTAALEMAAMLIDICEGDEVIMPSYTFVSTANAFVLRGASIVFVDVNPATMNIDSGLIESAISEKTKAIVPVHYGGVSCDMDKIMAIANKHKLYVIEDAAQAMMAEYKSEPVGVRGHIATYSFHETKNYTSGGEGGLLIINDQRFFERAEIIREKGTNRSRFFRGQVDKYTWVDIGSSYLPGELQVAHLYSQLLQAEEIREKRLMIWQRYAEGLRPLQACGLIELMVVPEECEHNGHLFFLKCETTVCRYELIKFLKEEGVTAVFHYIPLHSSPAGKKYGKFVGEDIHTTDSSSRLVRLPIFYNLSLPEVDYIIGAVLAYYEGQHESS